MLIPEIVKILTDAGIEENEANIEVKMLIEYFAGYSLVDILMGKKLDDEKLKMNIIIDKSDLKNLVDGHKLQLSIVKDLGNHTYLGKVNKIIGHKNDPDIDIKRIIAKYICCRYTTS